MLNANASTERESLIEGLHGTAAGVGMTSSSAMAERPRELDQRFQMGGGNLRLL